MTNNPNKDMNMNTHGVWCSTELNIAPYFLKGDNQQPAKMPKRQAAELARTLNTTMNTGGTKHHYKPVRL